MPAAPVILSGDASPDPAAETAAIDDTRRAPTMNPAATPTRPAALAYAPVCLGSLLSLALLAGHPPAEAAEWRLHVQVEGCVVDAQARPRAGRVEAQLPDGRALARALAGADGRFRMSLPAGAQVRLRADDVAPQWLQVGESGVSLSACLRPEGARAEGAGAVVATANAGATR